MRTATAAPSNEVLVGYDQHGRKMLAGRGVDFDIYQPGTAIYGLTLCCEHTFCRCGGGDTGSLIWQREDGRFPGLRPKR